MGKINFVVSNVKTKVSNSKGKIKQQKNKIKKCIHKALDDIKSENTFIQNEKKQISNCQRDFIPILKKVLSRNKGTDTQHLLSTPKIKKKQSVPLREKMINKLKGARFRYLNEQLYLSNGKQAYQLFKEDPDSFEAYHAGFKQQITQWPINPLDVIIKSLRQRCNNMVIADFGCGDAKLSESLDTANVHSFDLVALNERVTVCDMSHTPLHSSSVDIAVFCLSLMGTNLNDFIKEANRVLKEGGILKIAEVESRFHSVDQFVQNIEKFGFKLKSQDLSHNLFYFLDFQKQSNISKRRKKKLPQLILRPCLYKKR